MSRVAVFRDPAVMEAPWCELLRNRLITLGLDVEEFDHADDLAAMATRCSGVMWRFTHGPSSQSVAKAALAAIEHGLDLPVWPNHATRWHYDDKLAQAWLLRMAGGRMPNTTALYSMKEFERWLQTAHFPQVFKLRGGASSQSVCRVDSIDQARRLADRLFGRGLTGHHALDQIARGESSPLLSKLRLLPKGLARETWNVLRYGDQREFEPRGQPLWPVERTVALFQDFVPNVDHDFRVTVIGDRALAFRRFARPADFRISGSGLRDSAPDKIDLEAVREAHRLSKALGFQSMAYDFVRSPDQGLLLLEISYTFVASAVRECPGFWDSNLEWHAGQQWPQELIADDFARYLANRG
jgi:hypothetical protein